MLGVLELQRRAHEQVDRLENLAASLLVDLPKTYRERLTQQTRVAQLAERASLTAHSLLATYDDANGARQADLDHMTGDGAVDEFYARLDEVLDFHRRNPDEELTPMELEFMSADAQRDDVDMLDTLFSGEELYGRFVDLHALHERFINLKDAPRVAYVAYLEQLADASRIPLASRNAEYRSYLADLLAYLRSFISRAHPLFDLPALESSARAEFDSHWTNRSLPDAAGGAWHRAFDEDATPDLLCAACLKQFPKRAIYDRHLTDKKHRRAASALAAAPRAPDDEARLVAEARAAFEHEWRGVAEMEFLVAHLVEGHLASVVRATRENVERKQTLTETELADELAAMDVLEGGAHGDANGEGGAATGDAGDADDSDTESDDGRLYNPMKLPLGWDGKPIPYWLYKLHGLGVEYPCEICGNYVYMGRKAFERHFQEWRHTQGMKALGIPNSKHFMDVVKIDDALALWERIKGEQSQTRFRPDVDEEFEDSEGNVMSRKVYEDLARQGLL